jgi:putative ABC transport system permease protein
MKPLPYRDPGRLVQVSSGATPVRFSEIKAAARSFTGIAAYTGPEGLTLAGGAEPELVIGDHVSANFLKILGRAPLVGRSFRPEEDSPGGAPVAMISAELWQKRFGRDPHIAGKNVILGATPYTIIGVLPPAFPFPVSGVDVWMTAPTDWNLMTPASRALSPFLTVFGRLKPGVSLKQADVEMRTIRRQYALAHPAMLDAKPKRLQEIVPMKDKLVGSVRAMIWMLFGAVGFVLLIACANIAGLLLARARSRSREFAVRSALGATRRRLARQLLVESLSLAGVGGVMGTLLAVWSLRAVPLIPASDLPRAGEIRLDPLVLAFAAALTLATGLLFGLLPALAASRPDLIGVLRAAGASTGPAGHGGLLRGFGSRGLLVIGQVALSVVLLIGAALLTQTVVQLHAAPVGFDPSHLLTMRIALPVGRYDSGRKQTSFFEALLDRVRALRDVRDATAAWFLPMMGYAGTPVQDAAQPPLKLNERPLATIMVVFPGYFRTLAIPERRGRDFSRRDTADAPRVAIIDENLARRFWPAYPHGPDPVGRRILIGGVNPKPAEIVGIVPHVHQNLEDSSWRETVYVPFAQDPASLAVFAIRTRGDPLQLTPSVRAQAQALDPDQPIAAVRSMEDLMAEQLGQRRLILGLLASFAGVAVLLALIGIYGVIAYSVAQRTQEVGIRRALGAQQGDILRMVVKQGLTLALAGIALGIGGALALTRVMKSLLFRVSTTDPVTFAAIAVLFVAVALAASYLPARRAARIDPMSALRAL